MSNHLQHIEELYELGQFSDVRRELKSLETPDHPLPSCLFRELAYAESNPSRVISDENVYPVRFMWFFQIHEQQIFDGIIPVGRGYHPEKLCNLWHQCMEDSAYRAQYAEENGIHFDLTWQAVTMLKGWVWIGERLVEDLIEIEKYFDTLLLVPDKDDSQRPAFGDRPIQAPNCHGKNFIARLARWVGWIKREPWSFAGLGLVLGLLTNTQPSLDSLPWYESTFHFGIRFFSGMALALAIMFGFRWLKNRPKTLYQRTAIALALYGVGLAVYAYSSQSLVLDAWLDGRLYFMLQDDSWELFGTTVGIMALTAVTGVGLFLVRLGWRIFFYESLRVPPLWLLLLVIAMLVGLPGLLNLEIVQFFVFSLISYIALFGFFSWLLAVAIGLGSMLFFGGKYHSFAKTSTTSWRQLSVVLGGMLLIFIIKDLVTTMPLTVQFAAIEGIIGQFIALGLLTWLAVWLIRHGRKKRSSESSRAENFDDSDDNNEAPILQNTAIEDLMSDRRKSEGKPDNFVSTKHTGNGKQIHLNMENESPSSHPRKPTT